MAGKDKTNCFFKNSMSGQSAIEFLSIVSIALLIIVPASYLFLNQSRLSSDQVTSGQMEIIGNAIIGKAEEMYVLGEGSWSTIRVNIPEGLRESYISDDQDLVLSYDTRGGRMESVFFVTRFNMTNSTGTSIYCDRCSLGFAPGLNEIRIASLGSGMVRISKIN